MLKKSKFEVLPVVLVVLTSDGHVLVDLDEVSAGVEVGSSEYKTKKLGQGGMQPCNIADVIDVVLVDALVLQGRLIEIRNHQLDDSVSTNHFEVVFSTHTQKIKFDTNPAPPPPTPDDDGLKWYVVVVVALVVLLIVGLAYGMFRYIKKKRSDKNVSLLTEKEEEGDTEEVPNRGSINNPLDEELHKDED